LRAQKKERKYKSEENALNLGTKYDGAVATPGAVTHRWTDDQCTLNFGRISLFHKNEIMPRGSQPRPNGAIREYKGDNGAKRETTITAIARDEGN